MADSYGIPTAPAIKPLKHISPSQFSSLCECSLRAVWASGNIPNALPISPSSRVGIVVHQIIAMSENHSIDEDAFQKLWERCVNEQEEQMSKSWFERHLVPLSVTALDFHLKRSQCFLLLNSRDNAPRIKKPDASKRFHERRLQSNDGLVVGRADRIEFDDGGATIIDFKTGNVSGQSIRKEVLTEHQEQLKLYAALFHEECREWPRDLIVVSLDGKKHRVDYDENECLTLLEESKDMLRRVNSLIEADEKMPSKLASPSQDTCRYCLYRPLCEPYSLARQSDLAEGWPSDAWGIVTEKKILRNGRRKIILTPFSGAPPINIRGLRMERHPALEAFQKVGVFSLDSDNSRNDYKEGLFTTIYGIE